HELHRDSRRDESDYGQFFESFAVLDDTFLDAQPLAFKRPKQLFDVPALPIPADHASAWATVSTLCVVNSRHMICCSPDGGLSSRASMAKSSISSGALGSEQFTGLRMRTRPKRTAIQASRAVRLPDRSGTSSRYRCDSIIPSIVLNNRPPPA